jgi:dipeptidyl-peptidase-4
MVKKLIMIFSLLIICCYLPAETMNWTIEKWQQIPNILGTVPRAVQWSADGETAAFLWNNEGYEILDIYLYYPYKKKLVKLTDVVTLNTTTDIQSDRNAAQIKERMRIEGSGITSYVWHPDSNNIYFPYKGDVYRINIEEGTTTGITRTAAEELDPKISPDGKWLSFIRANDIWLLDLKKGNEIQLTTTGSETILNGIGDYIALEELERYSSYFWSPRSDAILYVSADTSPVRELIIPDYRGDYVKYVKQRRPRAGEPNAVQKVYTVSLNDPQPVLLDLLAQDDEYYVTRLRWSPDASTVLILKESRDLKKVDFILSSPASSQSKILYTETDQKWVNIRNQFTLFSKDSKAIYFTSEKSGFNHLYSLDIESGTEQMLTQGKWEITEINGIDKDDGIYFTSTRISPSQRHLDLYDTEDNRIIQKTFVEGWHSCNLSPNFNDVVEIYSSNILPGELYHFSLSEPKTIKLKRRYNLKLIIKPTVR